MSENQSIVMYGTTWCGGSRRCRLLFDRYGIAYKWIDIDQDESAGKYLETLNGGHRSVPTIVWPDGSKLTEPSESELAAKLGVKI